MMVIIFLILLMCMHFSLIIERRSCIYAGKSDQVEGINCQYSDEKLHRANIVKFPLNNVP
jgi:hypothetical protein